jgi:hypothetical protein
MGWGIHKVSDTRDELRAYARATIADMLACGTPGLTDSAVLAVVAAINAAPDCGDGMRLHASWGDGEGAYFTVNVEAVPAVSGKKP